MPELSALHIALLAVFTAVGAIAGWLLRSQRAEQEKTAVSAGWQEQIDAQRRESARLSDQNKGLMEQVSQFQAQHTDAKNRARELSTAVQEAFARRDELQREIKDVRNNLETVLSERNRLAFDIQTKQTDTDLSRAKDDRIEKLARELENWQARLPPLIERYRVRNKEAEQAEAELEEARARIRELEEAGSGDTDGATRIEPLSHSAELTDGLDASNDPADIDATTTIEALQEDTVRDDEATALVEALHDEAPHSDDADDDDMSADDSTLLGEAIAAELDSQPGDQRDDLQMIKGVGPAIEKTLNEMGIFSLRQIAEMNEYDIDRVARRLKGFHSRIHREDWIGQARMLIDRAAHA